MNECEKQFLQYIKDKPIHYDFPCIMWEDAWQAARQQAVDECVAAVEKIDYGDLWGHISKGETLNAIRAIKEQP